MSQTYQPRIASTHHQCPGGCGKRIPNSLLACSMHWYRVPRDLRHKIWQAYLRLARYPRNERARREHAALCVEAARFMKGDKA